MKIATLLAGLLLCGTCLAAEPPLFSLTGLSGWDEHGFLSRADTRYRLVVDDGRKVVAASCKDSAGGLYWRGDVDLTQTPVLHWSWKVDRVYAGLDEATKHGDDFPARVYVAIGSRWLPWTLRTLSYVWSNARPPAEHWPSPYSDQAQLFAVRAGDQGVGQWQQQSRNVRADFQTAFGTDVKHIGAVAVMSDCDDSDTQARAWFGDLHFAAR